LYQLSLFIFLKKIAHAEELYINNLKKIRQKKYIYMMKGKKRRKREDPRGKS
jgi:hypothetical protein